MPVNIKAVLTSSKSVQSTSHNAIKIDKNRYMSIKEIATYLDRSIYRTRQLGWDGLLGTEYKPEKEVYYLKEAVVAYKKIQDARGIKNTDLDESRMGKRVKFACELVNLLINQDTSLTSELKSKITETLSGYIKQAELLIKESDK